MSLVVLDVLFINRKLLLKSVPMSALLSVMSHGATKSLQHLRQGPDNQDCGRYI